MSFMGEYCMAMRLFDFFRRRAQHLSQSRVQFLPAAKDKFLAGKRVEFELLDRLHNFHRLARGWDVVEPAAGGEHLFVQLQNPISERIAVPEIVKEPAIEFGCRAMQPEFQPPALLEIVGHALVRQKLSKEQLLRRAKADAISYQRD